MESKPGKALVAQHEGANHKPTNVKLTVGGQVKVRAQLRAPIQHHNRIPAVPSFGAAKDGKDDAIYCESSKLGARSSPITGWLLIAAAL